MKILEQVEKVLGSKSKGRGWVILAMPSIVGVNKEVKDIERGMKEELEPILRDERLVRDKYAGPLKVLGEIDEKLRERVQKEYEGTEAIHMDGIGELVFPERTSFKVTDIKKVPKEYLGVDSTLVNKAIRNGLRKIPGIEVITVRGLTVKVEKE